MGRPKRADEAGGIYHMLNRANQRVAIFDTVGDYEAFEQILTDAIDKFQIKLFSYCLMPNHWHFVVGPEVDGEMSRFAQWLSLTHTQRHHAHRGSAGNGHLYQGRYKSFPVQSDEHFLTVNRYVERNPFAAGLCKSPEQWRWSSLWRWRHGSTKEKQLLAQWPIPRRPDWVDWVRVPLSEEEERKLQRSLRRGAPFGDDGWIESVARRFDLESTLRARGRPRKLS